MTRTGGKNSTPKKESRKNFIRSTPVRKEQRAIMARGRNGWFAPTGIWIERVNGVTVIGVRSKRFSGNWPIILSGNDDAMLSLIDRIKAALSTRDQSQRLVIPSGVPKLSQAEVEEMIRHIRVGDDQE